MICLCLTWKNEFVVVNPHLSSGIYLFLKTPDGKVIYTLDDIKRIWLLDAEQQVARIVSLEDIKRELKPKLDKNGKEKNEKARASRSDQQQLALLDERGVAAKKERAKLNKRIKG